MSYQICFDRVQVMRCVGSEAARTPHRQAGLL